MKYYDLSKPKATKATTTKTTGSPKSSTRHHLRCVQALLTVSSGSIVQNSATHYSMLRIDMSPYKIVYLIVLLAVLWGLSRIGCRPKNYPPGPPTLPFIGNLHQIPRKKRHVQFEKWAREYGPIYSLMMGTKVMIVLNSDEAIRDLVDKRGAIYSSRPELYIGQNILSGGLRVLFMVCIIGNHLMNDIN